MSAPNNAALSTLLDNLNGVIESTDLRPPHVDDGRWCRLVLDEHFKQIVSVRDTLNRLAGEASAPRHEPHDPRYDYMKFPTWEAGRNETSHWITVPSGTTLEIRWRDPNGCAKFWGLKDRRDIGSVGIQRDGQDVLDFYKYRRVLPYGETPEHPAPLDEALPPIIARLRLLKPTTRLRAVIAELEKLQAARKEIDCDF